MRLGGVFGRSEIRETERLLLDGLMPGFERKTGWLMAKQAGPHRMQALLGRGLWDAGRLGDVVRDYVIETPGTEAAVLAEGAEE